jgi:hypothetical protein
MSSSWHPSLVQPLPLLSSAVSSWLQHENGKIITKLMTKKKFLNEQTGSKSLNENQNHSLQPTDETVRL